MQKILLFIASLFYFNFLFSKNEIKSLKAQAQLIKPKILVGKNGLTDGTLQSIDEVLTADEIVKIKF